MSDGPHRSLKMSRGWKMCAERADNDAYEPAQVREAVREAIGQEWREGMSDSVCMRIRGIMDQDGGHLSNGQRVEELEALRPRVAGHVLPTLVLEHVIDAATRGQCGQEALNNAVGDALMDRSVRGSRQIEEHYRREATDSRATNIRKRIEAAMSRPDMGTLAERLLDTQKHGGSMSTKRTGLDEGVRL